MAATSRGSRRFIAGGVFAVSVVVALGAVLGFVQLLSRLQRDLRAAIDARPEITTTLVAARTVPIGTVLGPSDWVESTIPEGYVPPGAIVVADDLVGRTVRDRVLVGEFFRDERLAPAETGQGLNALIDVGSRAISLELRDGEQVSGFIVPGDRVDLIVTLPEDEQLARAAETLTLAQAVLVLAVDERISETATGDEVRTPQVTLVIGPAQIERVAHAVAVGPSKLTLRAAVDLHHEQTNGTVTAALLGPAHARLTTREFRERVSEAQLTRMIELFQGSNSVKHAVVDPRLIRPIQE